MDLSILNRCLDRFSAVVRRFAAFFSTPRVPVLLQLHATECGAACLAMILNFYGHRVGVSDCRAYCGGGRDGIDADTIGQAAARFGLKVKAYTIAINDLRYIPLPAVIHWRFNHFVVLEHWQPSSCRIIDPAIGKRRLTPGELDEGFTGVVLTFEPNVDFRPKPSPGRSIWRDYLSAVLRVPGAKGTLIRVLMVSAFLQLLGLIVPLFTQIVVDQILPFRMPDLLFMLGLGGLVLVSAYMVITYLRAALLIYLQAKIDSQVVIGFFEHVLALPYRYFQQRRSGDLLMRLGSNVTLRELITNQTLSIVLDGFFVLFYLAILLSQSMLFASVVLALGGIQILILIGTARRVRSLMQNNLAARAETESYLIEILQGIAVLKASGSEAQALQSWTGKFMKQLNLSLERHHFFALIGTALRTLQLLSPLALLWMGGVLVLDGTLSLGLMLALQALGISFLAPLASLIETGQQWQMAKAYMERIADVLEAEPEQTLAAPGASPQLRGAIAMRDVSFRYDPKTPWILKNISFTLAPHSKLALVGRTGAGKTTLAMLLLGLYRPTMGEITYDDQPLSHLNLRHVRRQFGAVLQEPFLFQGSIRQNIAFNQPAMPLEEVLRAARIACIHDEIMQMPMAYETLVGEGGAGLSGGQRQRLAIARAVAHQPVLLLLDEATSHLDTVTEGQVDRHLSQLENTRIVIAHRLSTIRNADVILVLDDGRIAERGTHAELLNRGGYYQRLVESQVITADSANPKPL